SLTISAAPFLMYASCSSTGGKLDMRCDYIGRVSASGVDKSSMPHRLAATCDIARARLRLRPGRTSSHAPQLRYSTRAATLILPALSERMNIHPPSDTVGQETQNRTEYSSNQAALSPGLSRN